MAVNMCYCVKLSPNKKSIFGLGMKSQILYFVLFASFLAVVSAADTDKTCASVQSIFEKKGMLSAVDIQALPNSDAGELCSNRGCCGPNARSRLSQQARSQLEGALRSELTKLADILANRAKRFDEFFRKLLKLSREGFHNMFKRTYGIIYEQHSYVFQDFFEQLERYYARGDTNFDAMMDEFFSILYQKMFIVLNSQYNFDEKYLKCVSEHMRDIQPFEDVPSKLSVQLRRAFVATRTFHKALRSGADVVNNMKQVGVTQECVTAWARLRYCGTCAGEQPPACSRYCHNVLRGCLPTHADLSEQWDAYVDAVEKVADRLLGPFNIAMVVEPIDIKISEAIMSFQERNQEISQKIFAGCGKPDLGGAGGAGPFFAPDRTRRFARAVPDFDWYHRSNDVDDFEIEASFESLYNNDASLLSLRTPEGIRRATDELAEQAKSRERFLQYMRGKISLDDFEEHERKKRAAEPEAAPGGGELDYRAYEFEGKRGGKKKKPAASEGRAGGEGGGSGAESGPALERLVRETRARVRGSRRYWGLLPAVLCSGASVTTAPCFNGTHVASYTAIAAGEGTAALASNPEVRGAGGSGGAGGAGGSGGRAQLEALRALTARLKDAYNGVEVQWKDASDFADELQAAASSDFADTLGSGSGSGDGDDDTEPGQHSPDWQGPDDDEDRDYPEGSGNRAIEEPVPDGDRQPASEPPFIPPIDGSNVQTRVRIDEPATAEPAGEYTSVRWRDLDTPVTAPPPPPPPASAADRPSLHNALFTYALPVVCAWFGTIVTDLF